MCRLKSFFKTKNSNQKISIKMLSVSTYPPNISILYLLTKTMLRCPSNAIIIKMDDDIAVDMPEMIKQSKNNLQTIGGWVHSKMNVRRRNSKWSLSKIEFHKDTFPDFVSGKIFFFF